MIFARLSICRQGALYLESHCAYFLSLFPFETHAVFAYQLSSASGIVGGRGFVRVQWDESRANANLELGNSNERATHIHIMVVHDMRFGRE